MTFMPSPHACIQHYLLAAEAVSGCCVRGSARGYEPSDIAQSSWLFHEALQAPSSLQGCHIPLAHLRSAIAMGRFGLTPSVLGLPCSSSLSRLQGSRRVSPKSKCLAVLTSRALTVDGPGVVVVGVLLVPPYAPPARFVVARMQERRRRWPRWGRRQGTGQRSLSRPPSRSQGPLVAVHHAVVCVSIFPLGSGLSPFAPSRHVRVRRSRF
ncbi:hypothetical protein GY45DRAFT_510502 [Cubamyces sp. BRFM 1775]|nr:hypothetical protein GY45DRAFT_510502 [Cubamyces sp. BRFM 1775]